jgi:hypothetical protein
MNSRSVGQEWLVTLDDAETYIPEVGEVILRGTCIEED